MRHTDDCCAEINRTDAECGRVLKPGGARMSRVPSSFEDELVDFVLEEVDDLGGVWLTSGLEGVLMDDSGEITSSGVTSDMIDGSAAVAVASCDIIAAAFGRGPSELPDAIAQIVETHGEDMRGTVGLPDLANRVLAIVGNAAHKKFGGTKGINASQQEYQNLVEDVTARIRQVLAEHPGTWDYVPLEAGTFKVNWTEQR